MPHGTPEGGAPRLAILGGGLTGAALAIHALRAVRARPAAVEALDIAVVEPAAELGRGAAYGTQDPAHRINVPSHRMSLLPEDPGHLTRWLFARGHLPDAASTAAPGEHYVPRALFGTYAAELLAEVLAEAVRAAGPGSVDHGSVGPGAALRHRRARAVAVAPEGLGWRVALDDGSSLDAAAVAVCTGHPAPVPPCPVSESARRHPGFVGDPWRRHAFARLPPGGDVLIVGTGLTMLDAAATLDRIGHRGAMLAVSRRGLLPRPQGAFPDGFDPFAEAPLPRTATDLLRTLREGVDRLAPAHGWQAVADAFRARLAPLWRALPPAEQRRVARRLLPYWEVHRFRAAPQPHALVERRRAEGRLRVERAAVADIDVEGGRLAAELVGPGGARGRRRFDAIVVCTGPAAAVRADPLLRGLVAAGLARPDGVGTGVAVDPDGRVVDRAGAACDTLRAFGPITRGSFGEMTGEPDIARHLARSAPGLLAALERARAA